MAKPHNGRGWNPVSFLQVRSQEGDPTRSTCQLLPDEGVQGPGVKLLRWGIIWHNNPLAPPESYSSTTA